MGKNELIEVILVEFNYRHTQNTWIAVLQNHILSHLLCWKCFYENKKIMYKKFNLIAGGAFSCMTEEFQRFRSKNTAHKYTSSGSRFFSE